MNSVLNLLKISLGTTSKFGLKYRIEGHRILDDQCDSLQTLVQLPKRELSANLVNVVGSAFQHLGFKPNQSVIFFAVKDFTKRREHAR